MIDRTEYESFAHYSKNKMNTAKNNIILKYYYSLKTCYVFTAPEAPVVMYFNL